MNELVRHIGLPHERDTILSITLSKPLPAKLAELEVSYEHFPICRVCNAPTHTTRGRVIKGRITCWKCLDFTELPRVFEGIPVTKPTRENFLRAYEFNLKKVYKWAKEDPEKLKKFMESVEHTLSVPASNSWTHVGACVTTSWHDIGLTGNPSLKALRELPRE